MMKGNFDNKINVKKYKIIVKISVFIRAASMSLLEHFVFSPA